MKCYSLLVGTITAVLICASSFAQDKATLQPKVEQVNENVVLLSHLTGAEYFDGVVNVKDISAVVTRSAGK